MRKFKTHLTVEHIKENQRISELTELMRGYFGPGELKKMLLNEKAGPRSKEALIKIIKRVMDNPRTTADQLETILKNVTMPLADKSLNNLFQDKMGLNPVPQPGKSGVIGKGTTDKAARDEKILQNLTAPLVKALGKYFRSQEDKMNFLEVLAQGDGLDANKLLRDAKGKMVDVRDYFTPAMKTAISDDIASYLIADYKPSAESGGTRGVGAGEFFFILMNTSTRPGDIGKGDINMLGKNIEMKSGGGGMGHSKNMGGGFERAVNSLKKAGRISKKINKDDLFFTDNKNYLRKSKGSGFKLLETEFNKSGSGVKDLVSALESFWKEMSSLHQKVARDISFDKCVSGSKGNLEIDINHFMHLWVSNVIKEYQDDSGFDMLMVMNPSTFSIIIFDSYKDFYKVQKNNQGPISYDFAVSNSGGADRETKLSPRIYATKYELLRV